MTPQELIADLQRWRDSLNRHLHPIYTNPKKHRIVKAEAQAIWLMLSEINLNLQELERRRLA